MPEPRENAHPRDLRVTSAGRLGALVNRFGIYGIAILFVACGAFLPGFFTIQNFLNIVDAVSLLGIVAVGMAFVTYSGHYADLSVPTTMAFTGIIAVEMLKLGFVPAMASALAVGAVIGIVNGVVVGKFRANPIIWTLAMSYVTMGIIRLAWANKQIYPDVKASSASASAWFDNIYRFRLFDAVGLTTLLLVAFVVIGQFILTRTPFGAQLKYTGSSLKAARFSGIHVDRVVGLAFVLSSLAATAGGLCVTSLSRVGAWYNGKGYDFNAVTAIVIGGMTLAGGRGTIVGVLGGVLVIGLMNNIMTLIGIGTFSQSIVRGIVFIAVVGIHAKSLRSQGRDDA